MEKPINLEDVNPELEKKINEIACEAYGKDFNEQVRLLKQAFDLIPKPVTDWSHPTAMICMSLARLYFNEKQYDKVEEWMELAIAVANKGFYLSTSPYMFGGIFYYETGNLDKAYRYFDIVYEDSRYRPFSIENKKYWQFYKETKEKLYPPKPKRTRKAAKPKDQA